MKKLMFMLFTLLMWAGCGSVSHLPSYGSLVNGGLPGFTFNVESCLGNAVELPGGVCQRAVFADGSSRRAEESDTGGLGHYPECRCVHLGKLPHQGGDERR